MFFLVGGGKRVGKGIQYKAQKFLLLCRHPMIAADAPYCNPING